jgi:hypothetical protein
MTVVTSEMSTAFKGKIDKYRQTQLQKDVIPIVLTPSFKIYDESYKLLSKYVNNMQSLLGDYAY